MIKKFLDIFWYVWEGIFSIFRPSERRARRDRRRILYSDFPFKERRTFIQRLRDRIKYLPMLIVFFF